jgi:hypothetical protein
VPHSWYCYSLQGFPDGDGHPCSRVILGFLAVDPDVAEPLAVVALCFVCFDNYDYVRRSVSVKICCDF